MALLDFKHLTKRWPTGRLALDDVSFEVREGEILGLLGHNGAGKSTIMGITLGMVRPDAGEVRIGGRSVQKDRAGALRQIGAIYEAACFYDYLSGWQNLRVFCSLSGWWDEAEARRAVETVQEVSREMEQIEQGAHEADGMMQRISAALEQQSAAVQQINNNMASLNQIAESNASASEEITATVIELSKIAGATRQEVDKFSY